MAERHDQEQRALLVLEKQVLGVPAGELALQPGALRDSEHRRVLDGLGLDPQLGEAREQLVTAGGQGTTSGTGKWSAVKSANRQAVKP